MRNYKPTVDIILCCYNQERYIEKAVQSIVSQKTEAGVRVIVADDCSTDGTLEIIRQYEQKSSFPFTYLKGEGNVGFHANYKRAFAACEGDYTAILEGDDWWNGTGHIQQHIDFLRSHWWCSMSFNRIEYYFEDNGKRQLSNWPFARDKSGTFGLKYQLGQGNQIGNLSSCVFRTKYVKQLPEEFYELNFADWELGIMMAKRGPIGILKESTSTYRVNGKGQWTSLSVHDKVESELASLENITPFLSPSERKYADNYRKSIIAGISPSYPTNWKTKAKQLLHIRKARP